MSDKPYIAWELECIPQIYSKVRCQEFIDRQTLTHVICNVNRPETVSVDAFHEVMNAIAETLDLFPWLKSDAMEGMSYVNERSTKEDPPMVSEA